MKNKILNFVSASILVLILCISFTSASIEFTDVTGATQSIVSGNTATITFKLNETNEGDLENILFNTPLSLGTLTSNNINGTITSLNQTNKSSLITLTINVPEGTTAQNYTGTLTVTAKHVANSTVITKNLPITLTVTNPIQPEEITSCIAKTNLGSNLKIKIDDIKVNGFGEDTEWLPMDEIEVEVQIENNGNDDIRDIKLSWGLYNKATDVWNIGDEDQDDVSVYFYNKELGIAQEVIVGSIDAFDSEKIEVTLETTKEMEQKTYQITN